MALFVTKEGKRKSTIALSCFFAALLFLVVFGVLYALLTEPLHKYVSWGDGTVEYLHSILIGALGTAICCGLFFLRDKRIVPYTFAGLAGFVLLCSLTTLQLEASQRGIMLYVILLYALAPIVIGNLVSWTVYLRLKRRGCSKAS